MILFYCIISNRFTFFEYSKIFIINMVTILVMSAKLDVPGLLGIKNNRYGYITPDYDVIKKILSRDSNYIVDVVKWPKFDNCSISIWEFIITSILKGFDLKNRFFSGDVLIKFNNFGLALCMIFKFYSSLTKAIKLQVKKFWRLILAFVEVTGEKMVGGGRAFCSPFSPHPE